MQKRSTADLAMLSMALAIYLWLPAYVHRGTVARVLSDPGAPAWIQAVGSLLAVGAVFSVWRLDRQREQRDAVQFAIAFGRSLVGAHDMLIRAATANDAEAVGVAAALVSEAYSIGKEVPLHQLPAQKQKMMVELRALTVMIQANTERWSRSYQPKFEQLLSEADGSARKVLGSLQKGGVARLERV